MEQYFLTVRFPLVMLGDDCLESMENPKPSHEKEPHVFFQTDHILVAEGLLEVLRRKEDASLQAIFDIDTAHGDWAQRVLFRQQIDLLESIAALGDWDPGVWADVGYPSDRRTRLLVSYYRKAEEFEPLVRSELAEDIYSPQPMAPPDATKNIRTDAIQREIPDEPFYSPDEARIGREDKNEILYRELFDDDFVWYRREKLWQRELGLHAPTSVEEIAAIVNGLRIPIPEEVKQRIANLSDMMDSLGYTDDMLINAIKNDRKTTAPDSAARGAAGQELRPDETDAGSAAVASAIRSAKSLSGQTREEFIDFHEWRASLTREDEGCITCGSLNMCPHKYGGALHGFLGMVEIYHTALADIASGNPGRPQWCHLAPRAETSSEVAKVLPDILRKTIGSLKHDLEGLGKLLLHLPTEVDRIRREQEISGALGALHWTIGDTAQAEPFLNVLLRARAELLALPAWPFKREFKDRKWLKEARQVRDLVTQYDARQRFRVMTARWLRQQRQRWRTEGKSRCLSSGEGLPHCYTFLAALHDRVLVMTPTPILGHMFGGPLFLHVPDIKEYKRLHASGDWAGRPLPDYRLAFDPEVLGDAHEDFVVGAIHSVERDLVAWYRTVQTEGNVERLPAPDPGATDHDTPASQAHVQAAKRLIESLVEFVPEEATEAELAYAENATIRYLEDRFGEQDDALGNWPADWQDCPEARMLYERKLMEYRAHVAVNHVAAAVKEATRAKQSAARQSPSQAGGEKMQLNHFYLSVRFPNWMVFDNVLPEHDPFSYDNEEVVFYYVDARDVANSLLTMLQQRYAGEMNPRSSPLFLLQDGVSLQRDRCTLLDEEIEMIRQMAKKPEDYDAPRHRTQLMAVRYYEQVAFWEKLERRRLGLPQGELSANAGPPTATGPFDLAGPRLHENETQKIDSRGLVGDERVWARADVLTLTLGQFQAVLLAWGQEVSRLAASGVLIFDAEDSTFLQWIKDGCPKEGRQPATIAEMFMQQVYLIAKALGEDPTPMWDYTMALVAGGDQDDDRRLCDTATSALDSLGAKQELLRQKLTLLGTNPDECTLNEAVSLASSARSPAANAMAEGRKEEPTKLDNVGPVARDADAGGDGLAQKASAEAEGAGIGSKGPGPAMEGEWSLPMSKIDMRVRLGNMAKDKFETFVVQYELKRINRQLYQIRLDTMDSRTRRRLETGR